LVDATPARLRGDVLRRPAALVPGSDMLVGKLANVYENAPVSRGRCSSMTRRKDSTPSEGSKRRRSWKLAVFLARSGEGRSERLEDVLGDDVIAEGGGWRLAGNGVSLGRNVKVIPGLTPL
jgi:hypothetical protein